MGSKHLGLLAGDVTNHNIHVPNQNNIHLDLLILESLGVKLLLIYHH
jgi:hypothetical protein